MSGGRSETVTRKFKFDDEKTVNQLTENQEYLRWIDGRIAGVSSAIECDQTDQALPMTPEMAQAAIKRLSLVREDILSKMSKEEIAAYEAMINPVELSDEEAQAEREELAKRLDQNKDRASH